MIIIRESVPNIDIVTPDKDKGLTIDEAKNRMEAGLINCGNNGTSKSIVSILRENIFTYFNFIFLVFTVMLVFVKSYKDLTFIPIVLANMLIGTVQEIKAKLTLDRLKFLSSKKANVVRDGNIIKIDQEKLVRDDIVLLNNGDQVFADCEIVEGTALVNEALITGEADELTRTVGDNLISGSFIVSGNVRCVLRKVGEDSYISQLSKKTRRNKKRLKSKMLLDINKILIFIGIVIIPIGIMLFYQQYFINSSDLYVSVRSMTAALIGMVPEGLYLLTAVTLAVSAVSLGKKRVLVQDMKCIEILARVNVLCVDKTGTITENEMSYERYIESLEYESLNLPNIDELLPKIINGLPSDNETIMTLKRALNCNDTNLRLDIFSYTSFSSKYKYSSINTNYGVFILGAPEYILGDKLKFYKNIIDENSQEGYRVLCLVRYPSQIPNDMVLTESVDVMSFILLSNPVRKNAKKTFEYFASQSVEICVISGDNPATVATVAKKAGIKNTDSYLDTSFLSDDELIKIAPNYKIFGRVKPEQKRLIIESLQKNGNTVAMTGDGVNDVLALKQADCSVAMASGSEVASKISDLVLLDSDFSKMPNIVNEGRRVVNNIERSASLFLQKNIFSFLLAIFSIVFSLSYPLQPSQISFIGAFTIGIPAFFLAQEANYNIIKGSFIKNVIAIALPAGITSFLVVFFMELFGMRFNVREVDISVAAALLFAEVGFMILFKISRPLNKYRGFVCGACLAALAIISVSVGDFFGIRKISLDCIMLLSVFAIAADPVLRIMNSLINRFFSINYYIFRNKE